MEYELKYIGHCECRVDISKEFQSMLEAVEEDIAQGGTGLIDETCESKKKETKKEQVEHVDRAPDVEDPSLLDIGKLASNDTKHVDSDETEKLNELLQGLMLGNANDGASRGRGMFDEGDDGTDSDF